METWEDGLRGVPSPEKLERLRREEALKEAMQEGEATNLAQDSNTSRIDAIQESATANLKVARESAQELLDSAKETTGIRSQEDIRQVAADMLKLATVCLQEFMSGYRTGRDQEIDKMLHEYFQEGSGDENSEDGEDITPTRRRKPKRANLRDS